MIDSTNPRVARMDSYMSRFPHPDPATDFASPFESPEKWFDKVPVKLESIKETTKYETVEACCEDAAKSLCCTLAIVYYLTDDRREIRYFHR